MGYITAHCGLGNCEGTQNFSTRGLPLPSCQGVYAFHRERAIECTHECHTAFQQIRQLMDELDTVSAIDAFTGHATPTVETDLGLPIQPVASSATVAVTPVSVPIAGDSLAPVEDVPPSLMIGSLKDFAPTPTGRAARGELEENVRLKLVMAHRLGADFLAQSGMGPKVLAESINPDKPPSQGAVYAVLKRWQRDELVELADRPFRFIRFTEAGIKKLVY